MFAALASQLASQFPYAVQLLLLYSCGSCEPGTRPLLVRLVIGVFQAWYRHTVVCFTTCCQRAHEGMTVEKALHNARVGKVVVDGPEAVFHALGSADNLTACPLPSRISGTASRRSHFVDSYLDMPC